MAAAFDTLLHSGVDGEVYNIGCEDEYTNLEVAEKIVKMVMPECKDPKEQITFVADRPFNDVRYYINSDKLMALGWKPEVSFEDGLKQTVEWFQAVRRPARPCSHSPPAAVSRLCRRCLSCPCFARAPDR